MDIKSPNTRTHDLGLAAALVSCGFELRTTNRDINGRVYFAFKQVEYLAEAINEYWADTLHVPARSYSDNIKMLKSRIYAED
jgi:hypothetical protein